ncbi:686_t:CDS:1 [Ambispora gerdemannii]|uniref:686_t:CDS:1 n=1 Tax=Ambispora gerdemannii TaxID=144530 RepID=A0A9N9FJ14_9GLOM|nr:686_t:CDS:1 [Ambispora gerdemannii]
MGKGNSVNNSNNGEHSLSSLHRSTNNITRRKTNTQRKRATSEIPKNFDTTVVYQPRFELSALICTTKKKPRSSNNPPRPPNSFFLLKNALLLELWQADIKPTMPQVCRLAKQVWHDAPSEVKARYDSLSTEALKLHQSEFPGYKYQPRRAEVSKSKSFPVGNGLNGLGMMTTFSINTPVSTVNREHDREETGISGSDTESSNISDVSVSPNPNPALEFPYLTTPETMLFPDPIINPLDIHLLNILTIPTSEPNIFSDLLYSLDSYIPNQFVGLNNQAPYFFSSDM